MARAEVNRRQPPQPTKEEALAFIRQMQKELLPQAREIDDTLTYFIEMAMIQASDLLSGQIKEEVRNNVESVSLRY